MDRRGYRQPAGRRLVRAAGQFRSPRRHSTGKPDLWPNMPMLNALQAWHEYSGDERVIRLMTKYFAWELAVPDDDFLPPLWQQQRGGDNLASVYWLYNRTGDKRLLDLAAHYFQKTANWTEGVPNWHNVNIAQALRGSPTYYLQSKDPRHLSAAGAKLPDGVGPVRPGAGRNVRRRRRLPARLPRSAAGGGNLRHRRNDAFLRGDPQDQRRAGVGRPLRRRGAELAARRHHPRLPRPALSDRPQPDRFQQHQQEAEAARPRRQYQMNPHAHRCCQLNMGQGWPYFAEHLWMATPDNGLALVFYCDSKVTAKVGDGAEVSISQATHYPFDESVELSVSAPGRCSSRCICGCRNGAASAKSESTIGRSRCRRSRNPICGSTAGGAAATWCGSNYPCRCESGRGFRTATAFPSTAAR